MFREVVVDILPKPVNEPPKTMCPLGAFVIEFTGASKPANGKLDQPPFFHATALLELPASKEPPKYTIPLS